MCTACEAGNQPAQKFYYQVAVKVGQNRTHRKSRINKKWGKQYGYKYEIRTISTKVRLG